MHYPLYDHPMPADSLAVPARRGPRLPPLRAAAAARRAAGAAGGRAGEGADRRPGPGTRCTPPASRGTTRAATACATGCRSTATRSTTSGASPSSPPGSAIRGAAARATCRRGPSARRGGTRRCARCCRASNSPCSSGSTPRPATSRERRQQTLTETVHAWRKYRPEFLPLPHPSPRNTRWLQVNPWFARDVLPQLQARVHELIR